MEITETTGFFVDAYGVGDKTVHVLHHIHGGATGGHIEVYACLRDPTIGRYETPIAGTLTRSGGVVTAVLDIGEEETNPFIVGDIVAVSGNDNISGEYIVDSVSDNKITFYAAGDDISEKENANFYLLKAVKLDSSFTGIPSSDGTTSYYASFGPINAYLWFQVEVADGTHTIDVRVSRD